MVVIVADHSSLARSAGCQTRWTQPGSRPIWLVPTLSGHLLPYHTVASTPTSREHMLACPLPTFTVVTPSGRQLLSAGTAQVGTPTHTHAAAYTGSELFPKPLPIVLPVSRLGVPRPDFNSVSVFMRNQYHLAVLQSSTQILSVTCGSFHVVILRNLVSTCRMSLTSSTPTPTATTR